MKHPDFAAGLFLALSLALSLVACEGATLQPDPTDKTAPTLSSSLPAEGASAVSINAKLALTFSETMDESSLELTANSPITLGTATWNPDSTSVAFANETLLASTAYTLTVNAKDISGNSLGATTLTFTTSDSADTTAPTTPKGLVATPANGQVTLTWQANPEADVAGYTVYVGTAQDTLESKDFVTTNSTTVTNLTNDTKYFFTIDAVDTATNDSSQTTPVSATPSATVTDTTSPTLQASNPTDGATGVHPRNLTIKLVFSEPMDTTTFSLTFAPPDPFPALQALEPAATTPFEVSWSEGDTVATLEPVEVLLKENTTFTLSLSAKDQAGNALTGDNEIAFTTGQEPRLVSSTPTNGATDVPVEKFEIKLVFSKPMDTTTFKVEPTLEPKDIPNYSQSWTLTWSADDTVLTLTTSIIPGYFLEDSTYTLLLTGTDKTGIPLLETTVTFKTVDDPTPPTVVEISPLDGATDEPLSPVDVFVYFDDLMDETATFAALSSSSALPCDWQHFFFTNSANDKDLGSAFACRSTTEEFQPDTTYTITISTDAKDTSGNALAAPYSFSFKTIATTEASRDFLGFTVAFDGISIVAGSPGHTTNTGAVYVFAP